jgi:hypothetical protein
MKKCAFFWVVCVILAFQVGPLAAAQGDVVGRLTQVEGRVDLLRGGQLPATPVKLEDGVQTGDVLRTKSLSKAQITFLDNSTMTIAPESRVAIEAYMFDPVKNKRNVVVQLFQGLAHVVVSKVFKSVEPDFVVKTHTAIMGVRGTDFGVRLQPNSSTILNFEGLLQVGNIFPEVGQLSQRAFKVAYSFGSEGEGGHHWVFLDAMYGTTVGMGLPPTMRYKISLQEMKDFMNLMNIGVPICRLTPEEEGGTGGGSSDSITGCGATTGQQGTVPSGSNLALLPSIFMETSILQAYTPPPVRQANLANPNENTGGNTPPNPTPTTYNFTLSIYGLFLQNACDTSTPTSFMLAGTSGGASPVLITAGGLATLTGELKSILPTFYLDTDRSTFTSSTFPKAKLLAGVYTGTIVGNVSGVQGEVLTGSATLNSAYIAFFGFKKYTLSNTATILVSVDPSTGKITYSYVDGSFTVVAGHTTISNGTSTGNGEAHPLFTSTAGTSTTVASGTMLATTASTSSTGSTENTLSEITGPQASGSNDSTPGFTGRGTHSKSFELKGDGRTGKHGPAIARPMAGHHQGPGPGQPVTNFNLTRPLTNPLVNLSQNYRERGGPGIERVGGHRESPRVLHHQKQHKRTVPRHQGPGGPVHGVLQGVKPPHVAGGPGNNAEQVVGNHGPRPGV